jgi:hypothetical protein
VLVLLNRWEGRAAQLRSRLGLDPQSLAAIAHDVGLVRKAQDDAIERRAAKGREIRLRRQADMRAQADGSGPGAA